MDLNERENRPLTVKEVAWFLRADYKTVLAMLKSGKLKGFKVGYHWRILVKDLKEYMGIEHEKVRL